MLSLDLYDLTSSSFYESIMMSPNYSKETFENTNLTLELSQTTVLRCLVLSRCVRESDFLRVERNIVNTTITDFLPLFFSLQTAHHLANSQRSRFPTQPSHRSPRLETSKPVGVAGRYSQVDGLWPGKDIRVLHIAHHRGK